MNEKGNKYALAALKDRRASIAGEIESLKRQLASRTEQLGHVDATISILEPGYQPSAKIKRPRRVKLFKQGELNRLILDALREAKGKPLSTREVVTAVMKAQGHDEAARPALAPRVRTNLQYLSRHGQSVEKVGERAKAKWKLASDQLKLPEVPKAI